MEQTHQKSRNKQETGLFEKPELDSRTVPPTELECGVPNAVLEAERRGRNWMRRGEIGPRLSRWVEK